VARDFGVATSRNFSSRNPEISRSNFTILEFRDWSGKGLESLHRELFVHKIVPAVGSGARWPKSRWIKDTCAGLSPWEVHKKKDLGY
jgi:hypothetical protein